MVPPARSCRHSRHPAGRPQSLPLPKVAERPPAQPTEPQPAPQPPGHKKGGPAATPANPWASARLRAPTAITSHKPGEPPAGRKKPQPATPAISPEQRAYLPQAPGSHGATGAAGAAGATGAAVRHDRRSGPAQRALLLQQTSAPQPAMTRSAQGRPAPAGKATVARLRPPSPTRARPSSSVRKIIAPRAPPRPPLQRPAAPTPPKGRPARRSR
ncbi:hypothetical protein NDU88_005581 [Pleurodeles waltl]|uniref:Uncharacterized protein n=1 Tax=Pleurodeles waltl TaxID=8319 RepID=A0AAV7RK23_PLEWA|nr:hypothetical protein NDU88_005581 [Pleurodeles waltl]